MIAGFLNHPFVKTASPSLPVAETCCGMAEDKSNFEGELHSVGLMAQELERQMGPQIVMKPETRDLAKTPKNGPETNSVT